MFPFVSVLSLRNVLIVVAGLLIFAGALRGQDCTHMEIPTIPFFAQGSTCGAGDDVSLTNPCGAWFTSGEDYVYEFTVPYETCLYIELSDYEPSAASAMITTACPMDWSGSCVDKVYSATGATSLSMLVLAEPNITYHLTISSYAVHAPCTDYNLSISTNCPPFTMGDCYGALNLCEGFLYEESAPQDNGLYPDALPFNGCAMGNVTNEGWYRIDVLQDGILNFTLTPDGPEDYDWMLFDLTNAACNQISDNPDLVAGCNTYGIWQSPNGSTGISSELGGVGTANGPSSGIGPPFNADLQVFAGETYILLVNNWSDNNTGFTLDFTASTAVFGDEIPPVVDDLIYNCEGVRVIFSEQIDCATVAPEHFVVEGPGGPYTVTDLESNCALGSSFGAHFNLTVDPPFPNSGGEFQLVFDDDLLADLCGNFLEAVEVPFTVPPGISVSAQVLPGACGDGAGTFTVIAENAVQPALYSLNGGEFQSSPEFEGLEPGDYEVVVQDAAGCHGAGTVEVWEDVVSVTAGVDGYTCNNQFATAATLPQGFHGTWSGGGAVSFDDPTAPQTMASAVNPGVYELEWTVTNDVNCTISKSIAVDFTNPGAGNSEIQQLSCGGDCDGSFSFVPTGIHDTESLIVQWSAGNESAHSPYSVTGLCAGSHVLTLKTDSGCVYQEAFVIAEPEPLTAGNIVVKGETCPDAHDTAIEIHGGNATMYSFDGGAHFSPQPNKRNLSPGTYHLALGDERGCRLDTTVSIPSTSGPVAHFHPSPSVAHPLDPHFRFQNLSKDYTSSRWIFGFPQGLGFSNMDDPAFSFTGAEEGEYVVALVVRDDKGCLDTAFRRVAIQGDLVYYIPNAFTPDGDGLNDAFKPVFSNIDESFYHIRIFDRWGRVVFESDDVEEGWRGDQWGDGYHAGWNVYNYVIRVKPLYFAEARVIKGSVTVLR